MRPRGKIADSRIRARTNPSIDQALGLLRAAEPGRNRTDAATELMDLGAAIVLAREEAAERSRRRRALIRGAASDSQAIDSLAIDAAEAEAALRAARGDR